MAFIVGYDRHPASRAALLMAAELAGGLSEPVHVVHVADMSDRPISATVTDSDDAKPRGDVDAEHVGDALDWAHVQWTYSLRHGDPAQALVQAAEQHAAKMIVIGRPQHGMRSILGHIVSGTVARNLLRHSTRPVLVVPEFGDTA
ncbi:hypothetical protein A9X02_08970 [Mycobacterium malmoense]|nr:universal stress protein [Mycobacterium malmoense]OCB56106.1 hypothetical protein A9X02_08970 [Mycobacterium malmoense]